MDLFFSKKFESFFLWQNLVVKKPPCNKTALWQDRRVACECAVSVCIAIESTATVIQGIVD